MTHDATIYHGGTTEDRGAGGIRCSGGGPMSGGWSVLRPWLNGTPRPAHRGAHVSQPPPRKPIDLDTHPCPAEDCDRRVAQHLFACKPCWFRLPYKLRGRVWDTVGKPIDRLAVTAECVEHWRANPRRAGRSRR